MEIALLSLTTKRGRSCVWVLDHLCAGKNQILKLLNKSHPPSSRQMHFLSGCPLCSVLSLQADLTLVCVEGAEGNMANLEFRDRFLSSQETGYLCSRRCFSFLPFLPCHTGQRSFGSGPFSAALISKSQVESCPAVRLLDSLSLSSLTRKHLVTRAARILFCFPLARRSFLHHHSQQCIL